MTYSRKTCPICKGKIIGRTDKKFCSVSCKNNYHKRLTAHTDNAASRINKILHRNRSILQELLGKQIRQAKVSRIELEKRKFNFTYITKYTINNAGKEYRYVYDFSYMTFSDDTVLINKRDYKRRDYLG